MIRASITLFSAFVPHPCDAVLILLEYSQSAMAGPRNARRKIWCRLLTAWNIKTDAADSCIAYKDECVYDKP